VFVESNVSRNVQQFVSRNVFKKDFLESGSTSVDSLPRRNHSPNVLNIAPNTSREYLVDINVLLSRFHTSTRNVFV